MKKSEIYYSLAVVAWFAVVIMFLVTEDPRLPYKSPFLILYEGMFCGILPAGIFFALGMCAKYDEIERKRIKDIQKRRAGPAV